MGTVSFSPLVAADRPPTSPVAVLAGPFDSRRPARFSRNLLLLSQSLLSRVFPRSARMCRRRTASSQLSRRNGFPFHPAKCPSLFFLSRGCVHHFSFARRDSLFLLRRPFRHRCRHARANNQCRPPFALHF